MNALDFDRGDEYLGGYVTDDGRYAYDSQEVCGYVVISVADVAKLGRQLREMGQDDDTAQLYSEWCSASASLEPTEGERAELIAEGNRLSTIWPAQSDD